MRITVVGKGNVGGGLAHLWERAGHQVTRIGREGGEVFDAEVVLLAVPGDAIAEALEKLHGIESKTVIDATNLYGVVPPEGISSNAEFVKSKTKGPTPKSFNANYALLYARLGESRGQAEQPVVRGHRGAGGARSSREVPNQWSLWPWVI
jgi:8-hydroxy-5-deazaflavin:NADPH oxidoreductase